MQAKMVGDNTNQGGWVLVRMTSINNYPLQSYSAKTIYGFAYLIAVSLAVMPKVIWTA